LLRTIPPATIASMSCQAVLDEIRESSRGRPWWPRAIGLVLILWLMKRQLADDFYATPLSALDLGIHEAGHMLMGFAGQLIMIAAGSGFQILAPIVAGILFARQRDWFAVSFSFVWLGISTGEVGMYASDAVAQAMPLVSVGGGEVSHDWAWLLDHFGLLPATATVAGCFYVVAVACQIVGLLTGAWITWLMWRTRGVNPA
jgi:hypothetical protein